MHDPAIAERILSLTQKELMVRMKYLGAPLCFLKHMPTDDMTELIAADGERLFYNSCFIENMYMRGRPIVNRTYLHIVLHLLLRHPKKSRGRDPTLWDIAADAAVESIIDSLDIPILSAGSSPARRVFYDACLSEMPVLTAERIYLRLLGLALPESELSRLRKTFLRDDHSLWRNSEGEKQMERQDSIWRDMARETAGFMEKLSHEEQTGGELLSAEISAAIRDDVDYSAFLRRFAAEHEITGQDTDGFDYIYYTFGLGFYGNMPLVEFPETKEEKRIEDFVIAIDTSMSTSGELVREFVSATWAILRSTSVFTRRVSVRIIECDNEVRSVKRIENLEDLGDYMEHFVLAGGGATDFRPVFRYVDELSAKKEFASLKGLIYFTDGMGIYPEKPTPYETAFVFLEEPISSIDVPSWATRITITVPELEKAREEAMRMLDAEETLGPGTIVVPT